ncbi:hypothetical protein Tco_0954816 [Tanacetum coccineum]|uniref:Uncharacterized protein n=1 Tax=Tanacetum coccineum TaxID=301880 RepID=A0ABQ5E5G1_9ASTR
MISSSMSLWAITHVVPLILTFIASSLQTCPSASLVDSSIGICRTPTVTDGDRGQKGRPELDAPPPLRAHPLTSSSSLSSLDDSLSSLSPPSVRIVRGSSSGSSSIHPPLDGGEAKTTSTPTTQAQVTYVSESVLSSKFDAKDFDILERKLKQRLKRAWTENKKYIYDNLFEERRLMRSLNIRVNSFTMKMKILLEPTSNKLMVASDTLIDFQIDFSISIGEIVTHWFTLIVLSALRRSDNENCRVCLNLNAKVLEDFLYFQLKSFLGDSS